MKKTACFSMAAIICIIGVIAADQCPKQNLHIKGTAHSVKDGGCTLVGGVYKQTKNGVRKSATCSGGGSSSDHCGLADLTVTVQQYSWPNDPKKRCTETGTPNGMASEYTIKKLSPIACDFEPEEPNPNA